MEEKPYISLGRLFGYGLFAAAIIYGLITSFVDDEDDQQKAGEVSLETFERLEQKKEYAALIEQLYASTNPRQSKQVIEWLKARDAQGVAFYYYALARHFLISNQPYQALQYYMLAGLTARIDATRCADSSAAGYILFLERGFDKVHQYMYDIADSKAGTGSWALIKEEAVKDRAVPEWLCSQGTSPREYVTYIPDEIWQQNRLQTRQEFKAFIEAPKEIPEALLEEKKAQLKEQDNE